ncbi:MAG: radical SAM protein [Nitrospirota bacterium]
MQCTEAAWPTTEEYLRQFNAKTELLRTPVSGSIDLTHTCNLRCIHCYLGRQSPARQLRSQEMSTEKMLSVVDEITDAGCFEVVLTGGEPLIRKDFTEIYRHIKLSGILVTVFSNGTLITDHIVDLFGELPPHTIEISLYGATAETYEKITGVKGSYKKCLSGIEKLVGRNLPVRLKTILMTLNAHEFTDIEKIAERFGVKFRFDPAIFPAFNGDRDPIRLRVPPEEAIAREFASEKVLHEWLDYYEKHRDSPPLETLYACAAGVTNFHIDPCGNLQPCVMVTEPRYDLNSGAFLAGWQTVISGIAELRPPAAFPCRHCSLRALCSYCPAFFRLENGSDTIRSEYLCTLGKRRFYMIAKNGYNEKRRER